MQYIWQVNILTHKNIRLPVAGFQSPRQGTSAGGEPWRAAGTEGEWVYDPKLDFKPHLSGRCKLALQWHPWQRRGGNNSDKNWMGYYSCASHRKVFQFTSTIPEHSSDLNWRTFLVSHLVMCWQTLPANIIIRPTHTPSTSVELVLFFPPLLPTLTCVSIKHWQTASIKQTLTFLQSNLDQPPRKIRRI